MVDEVDTKNQVAVTHGVPKEVTLQGVDCAASQANVTESDKYDIGREIKKTKRGEQLTDEERRAYLLEKWVPNRRDEYPFSKKKKLQISKKLENP